MNYENTLKRVNGQTNINTKLPLTGFLSSNENILFVYCEPELKLSMHLRMSIDTMN